MQEGQGLACFIKDGCCFFKRLFFGNDLQRCAAFFHDEEVVGPKDDDRRQREVTVDGVYFVNLPIKGRVGVAFGKIVAAVPFTAFYVI